MKRFLFWLIVAGIVAAAGAAGYNSYRASRQSIGVSPFRTLAVRRGDIEQIVTSTGTVQPVLNVQVGASVSGPICRVCVDFNDKVKKGQLLAEVDPMLYKASLDQAKAQLATAKANLLQADAKLEQAKREWQRAQVLLPQKAIADTDYDLDRSNYEVAAANVAVAKAQIQQSEGALALAETNLGYTKITSPVDGIVTDRKVDPGQTVAAQFQTPVLFVVAPDLEKKVHVYASVDEADIGLIRDAQRRRQPVSFTVDAYPSDVFQGNIAQVRLNPTTVQNVVTYTVVVESSNAELKLLPGMTANLFFQIERHAGVLTVPNAALRFHPKPELVCKRDRPIVEDAAGDDAANPNAGSPDAAAAAREASTPASGRGPRYVWVVRGNLLAAVKVATGLSDKSTTELLSGDLSEGEEVVIGFHP